MTGTSRHQHSFLTVRRFGVSPLRICCLLAAVVPTVIGLGRVAEGRPGSDDLIVWLMGVAAVVGWNSFVAFSVYERVDHRLTCMDRQVTALGKVLSDTVNDYGDRRETGGYLAGARGTATVPLTRVK
jgi:hypothetical protein